MARPKRTPRKPSGPPGGAGGEAAEGVPDRVRRPPRPMGALEFVEVDPEKSAEGKAFLVEQAKFWHGLRTTPVKDPTIHYYDPDGPPQPSRLAVEKLSGFLGEFLAATGPNAPPGFAEVISTRAWAMEHNLRSIWAYTNFSFALTAAEVERAGVFGDWKLRGVNGWPMAVSTAILLLFDLRDAMEARWGISVEPGVRVEFLSRSPEFDSVAFRCPGPLHPSRRGIEESRPARGAIDATAEEWAALEWAKKAIDAGLKWESERQSGGKKAGNAQIENSPIQVRKTCPQKLIDHMRSRGSSTYDEVMGPVHGGKRSDGTVEDNVSEANKLLKREREQFALKTDTVGRRILRIDLPRDA